jgi:hypothetical protein
VAGPALDEPPHPLPVQPSGLAEPPQGAVPAPSYLETESGQRRPGAGRGGAIEGDCGLMTTETSEVPDDVGLRLLAELDPWEPLRGQIMRVLGRASVPLTAEQIMASLALTCGARSRLTLLSLVLTGKLDARFTGSDEDSATDDDKYEFTLREVAD